MFYAFKVIKVQWVTMVSISGLCSHTQNPRNYRVYEPTATRKRHVTPERLLQTHSTFSKSVMVSMTVSKL